MRLATEPMQNGLRNGIAADGNRGPDRIDFATSHPVSNLEDEEEESSESSSSSSQTLPDARDVSATGHAKSHAVSLATDTKYDANRGSGTRSSQPVMSNRELRDLLLRAIGDNVEQACRDLNSVKVFRELMREGCDLNLHILPELNLLAKSSKRLQTWRAPWLHQQIRDRRDASPDDQAAAAQTSAVAKKCFVEKGTPQWDAWMAYRLKVDGKPFTQFLTRGIKEGWFFDALWPPGYSPSAVAAE